MERTKHLIVEFAKARTRGDRAEMRRWWAEMLAEDWDRLRGYVGMNMGSTLFAGEFEEALSGAAQRLGGRAYERFTGSSIGEWRNYLKTVALRAAQDVQRVNATRRGREVVTEMERGDDQAKGASTHFEDAAVALDKEIALAREEAEEAEERLRMLEAYLEWALPQVSKTQRAVWERWYAGVSYAEIGEELGMSAEAAYQNKCRAQKRLNELKESYDS